MFKAFGCLTAIGVAVAAVFLWWIGADEEDYLCAHIEWEEPAFV